MSEDLQHKVSRIYATFLGSEIIGGTMYYKWGKISHYGDEVTSDTMTSPISTNIKRIKPTIGTRFAIDCLEINKDKFRRITSIKNTYKNLKCDLIRKIGDDFIFIKGKYRGKRTSNIPKHKIKQYISWLKDNTTNEATYRNCLLIEGIFS